MPTPIVFEDAQSSTLRHLTDTLHGQGNVSRLNVIKVPSRGTCSALAALMWDRPGPFDRRRRPGIGRNAIRKCAHSARASSALCNDRWSCPRSARMECSG
jgi:hypothetical protein